MSLNGAPVNKASWTLTREAILLLRPAASKLGLRTRLRIALLGCAGRRRGCRGGSKLKSKPSYTRCSEIPVVIGSRRRNRTAKSANNRQRVLTTVRIKSTTGNHADVLSNDAAKQQIKVNPPPALFLLNAAAITKPHAVEHLAADLEGCKADIAVVTETHLKKKHADHCFAINGYTMFRRDREGRRGGGVAIYVNSRLPAAVCSICPGDRPHYELLWVRVRVGNRDIVVGALYHPPRPVYQPSDILSHIEACMDALSDESVILAGDFNTLDNEDIISRCALSLIVHQPTRGTSNLDRIYVSDLCYDNVEVVSSAVKSDHMAVIAYTGPQMPKINKRRERRVFRQRSPAQHALFLKHLSQMTFTVDHNRDVQENFDSMYACMRNLLEQFYPEREITVTSTDPQFVTPAVKAMLRRKNRLMRTGRTQEAGAIAKRVRAVITRKSSSWLRNADTRTRTKETWAKVREVIKGRKMNSDCNVDGLTAQALNDHYSAISTDRSYIAPRLKITAPAASPFITEITVFRMLDRLRPTATGLDAVPAWFLRLGAPVFAAPIAELFNLSITAGIVPRQWKVAIITPVPKITKPMQPKDFRPISITPVLSRMLERHIVRTYIYPALHQPPSGLRFTDQFAFRPTGSTVAALIALIHTVLTKLSTDHYVHVFTLDFTKAFDTVRHAAVMEKMAQLALPDQVYNWIGNFLQGHSHCTKFAGKVSELAEIFASIIQGSGLGPAAFLVTAADLRPIHDGNEILKYADDTYLVIPAANTRTCPEELMHIEAWAATNNMQLNNAKTKEIVFRSRSKRGKEVQLPPSQPAIERVNSITALGVVINDQLTATDHVSYILTACTSLLYALRVLRCHGIPDQSLKDVFQATVLAKITYCLPAWSGLCTAADRTRLNSFLRRCVKLGYYSSNDPPTISSIADELEDTLFKSILRNAQRVLQPYLEERPQLHYNLRDRPDLKSTRL